MIKRKKFWIYQHLREIFWKSSINLEQLKTRGVFVKIMRFLQKTRNQCCNQVNRRIILYLHLLF